jgi:hypothetical protein
MTEMVVRSRPSYFFPLALCLQSRGCQLLAQPLLKLPLPVSLTRTSSNSNSLADVVLNTQYTYVLLGNDQSYVAKLPETLSLIAVPGLSDDNRLRHVPPPFSCFCSFAANEDVDVRFFLHRNRCWLLPLSTSSARNAEGMKTVDDAVFYTFK